MPPTHFPLRWESTGDQWWFASPIDYAAAKGHYDLVRELLHIDTNLLIQLTSLPRIRRLETVWDDGETFYDVAKCRSQVARKLLQECETKNGKGHNSLIRAGYGGWLLYTAASAGDVGFVKELLGRDPCLVFGEGEYGVTDMLYAAARSKSSEVFGMLFDYSISPRGQVKEVSSGFKSEIMNRAVHAAARGGNLAALTDLLGGGDVLAYRDGQGSTVLHTASGRGQVEVVKNLISSHDIINSVDNRGNTALHVAAYRGHLAVIEVLISASPSSTWLTNNYGYTFLHMAVSGFQAPNFRRIDRQIELVKQLASGNLINIEEIINVRNNDGRTVLHMAVGDNIKTDIVELLMSVPCINLNIRDADGNTPLDLLKQRPWSSSSEILIKRLISAGGISDCQDQTARRALLSHLRMHGIGGSPGTSFRIPDAEIFLYTGIEDVSDFTSTEYGYSGEIPRIGSRDESNSSKHERSLSLNSRLKNLLLWPGKKERNKGALDSGDDNSIESYRMCLSSKNSPVPLRQQFSRLSSLPNNKRITSLQGNTPRPSTKKQFARGHSQGVLFGSPSSAFSGSSWSSPVSADKRNDVYHDSCGSAGPASANQSPNIEKHKMKRKHGSFNLRLMNNYSCFGVQGLAVENSVKSPAKRKPES